MLVTIHKELNNMGNSLEYAQNQIKTLQQSNQELQTSVTSLQQMQNVSAENKLMRETILHIQTHSMCDNLIFSRIPESKDSVKLSHNPELIMQNFMLSQLKLPDDVVQNITFHRVHLTFTFRAFRRFYPKHLTISTFVIRSETISSLSVQ